jgi:hypothetical protein
VLDNGIISAAETNWLRGQLLADNKIDASEARLLKALKRKAKKIDPSFDKLYAECVTKAKARIKAKAKK